MQQRRPVLLEFGEGAHNCYLWRPEEEVIVGTRDDFRGNLKDENMLYLSDARKDIRFIHNCQTILFSSPRESNFHDFLKSGAEIYFMPLWTREELELLRDPVYGDRVSSSRVDMISAVYGPTPRYTLQIAAKQSDFGNWSDEELRNRNIVSRGGDRLGQALSSANISLYFAFEGYETGNYSNEFSFLLLHMDTTDFSIPRLRWASTYVWDKLMERNTKEMLYFAHRLVFGASKERKLGSLAGHTFENLMQDAVRCGCASASREIKALSTVGGRSDPPLPNRRLPRLEYKTLKEFQKMEEYVYYQSDRPNEPAVDSFVVMKKELVLFQFTVAEVHPVDAKGLEDVISKVISCLGALDKISLVFVLPKYRYDEWKSPQRIVSGKKQLKNLSKYLRRVVQYALQVQEEATRNAFPEVPPNPYSLGKRGRTHC